jgi:hypothetical protein
MQKDIVKENFLFTEVSINWKISFLLCSILVSLLLQFFFKTKGKTGYRMEFVYRKAFYRAVSLAV